MTLRQLDRADELAKRYTAFRSFLDLCAAPAYRPSLRTSQPGPKGTERATLADFYDSEQANRGDARRAFRY